MLWLTTVGARHFAEKQACCTAPTFDIHSVQRPSWMSEMPVQERIEFTGTVTLVSVALGDPYSRVLAFFKRNAAQLGFNKTLLWSESEFLQDPFSSLISGSRLNVYSPRQSPYCRVFKPVALWRALSQTGASEWVMWADSSTHFEYSFFTDRSLREDATTGTGTGTGTSITRARGVGVWLTRRLDGINVHLAIQQLNKERKWSIHTRGCAPIRQTFTNDQFPVSAYGTLDTGSVHFHPVPQDEGMWHHFCATNEDKSAVLQNAAFHDLIPDVHRYERQAAFNNAHMIFANTDFNRMLVWDWLQMFAHNQTGFCSALQEEQGDWSILASNRSLPLLRVSLFGMSLADYLRDIQMGDFEFVPTAGAFAGDAEPCPVDDAGSQVPSICELRPRIPTCTRVENAQSKGSS